MNTNKDIIIYILIAILISLLIYIITATDPFEPGRNNDSKAIQEVHMIITTPTWTINYTSTNTINTTIADLLFEWASMENISIDQEYYSGYDTYLITGINGTQNGQNNSYWQFYVNGEYATQGSSSYYLENNDVVEWRFEPSSW